MKEQEDPIKIKSKVFNFEISTVRSPVYKDFIPLDTGLNIDIAYSFWPEILEFLHQLFENLFSIYQTLRTFNVSSVLVSWCLFENLNWKKVENRYKKRVLHHYYKKSNSSKLDEKHLKVFKNKERYEGRIVGGKFDGFGKYYFADGSVYAGEFKNSLRNGLGTFKFSDGRIHKGYWENNLMDGKGYLVNGGIKIYAIWKKNKLIQETSCIIFHN